MVKLTTWGRQIDELGSSKRPLLFVKLTTQLTRLSGNLCAYGKFPGDVVFHATCRAIVDSNHGSGKLSERKIGGHFVINMLIF